MTQNWIDVNKELPEDSVPVLVWGSFEKDDFKIEVVHIGMWDEYERIWLVATDDPIEVIIIEASHWMPLPPNPKESPNNKYDGEITYMTEEEAFARGILPADTEIVSEIPFDVVKKIFREYEEITISREEREEVSNNMKPHIVNEVLEGDIDTACAMILASYIFSDTQIHRSLYEVWLSLHAFFEASISKNKSLVFFEGDMVDIKITDEGQERRLNTELFFECIKGSIDFYLTFEKMSETELDD